MSHESQKCLLFRLRKSRMSLNQFIVLRGAISSHCYNGGSFVGEKSYEDRHESSIYGSRLLAKKTEKNRINFASELADKKKTHRSGSFRHFDTHAQKIRYP